MPFLRFSRDRRGYESTFLVHTYRRRGTLRSQVLYWFRSPPDVKVGRVALDDDVMRAIEERHPDLSFDWPKILQRRLPPRSTDDSAGERRRRRQAASKSTHPRTASKRAAPKAPARREKRSGPTAVNASASAEAVEPAVEETPGQAVPASPIGEAPAGAAGEDQPARRRRRSRRGGVRRTRRRREGEPAVANASGDLPSPVDAPSGGGEAAASSGPDEAAEDRTDRS